MAKVEITTKTGIGFWSCDTDDYGIWNQFPGKSADREQDRLLNDIKTVVTEVCLWERDNA